MSICSHDNEFFNHTLHAHIYCTMMLYQYFTKHLPPLLLKLNNSAHGRLETMLES